MFTIIVQDYQAKWQVSGQAALNIGVRDIWKRGGKFLLPVNHVEVVLLSIFIVFLRSTT